MRKLQKITSSKGYDDAASAYGKDVTFFYILSFIFMIFAIGVDSSNWIWVAVVFFIGMFAASLILGAAGFWLSMLLLSTFEKKSGGHMPIIIGVKLLIYVATFFFTRYLFLWLLT